MTEPTIAPPGGSAGLAARNTGYLLLASIGSRLMGLVLVAYLAREFAPAGLGGYNLVVAYAGLFALVADLGMSQYVTRSLALPGADRERELRTGALGALLLGLVALALCNGLAVVLGYDGELRLWILIASLPAVLGPGFLGTAVLSADLRGRTNGTLMLINQALGSIVSLIVVLAGLGITALLIIQTTQALVYVALIVRASRIGPTLLRSLGGARVRHALVMIRSALPLGFAAILATLYYRFDVLLLSLLDSQRAVGLYSAAYRLSEALHILPSALAATMLPLAARFSGDPKARTARALTLAFEYLVVLALPIAVGCIALAEPLMAAVYGSDFASAGGAFAALMVGEFAFFFGSVLVAALIGLGHAKRALVIQAVVIPINAVACVALIPSYGYHAAAVITAVTEVLVALVLVRELRGRLEHPSWFFSGVTVARTAVASAAMLAVLLLARSAGWPVVALIALGAATYGVAALAIGVLRRGALAPVLPALETSSARWARVARRLLRG